MDEPGQRLPPLLILLYLLLTRYNGTHRKIIIDAERCLFCGYSLKRARLNVRHVGKFTVKFRRNWKINRHTRRPSSSSLLHPTVSVAHYIVEKFCFRRDAKLLHVQRPRIRELKLEGCDSLSRVYYRDKLFMNPSREAKGENSRCLYLAIRRADDVNFFSNITGSSRNCRFDMPRIFARPRRRKEISLLAWLIMRRHKSKVNHARCTHLSSPHYKMHPVTLYNFSRI